jgi:hypothetical protein
MSNGQGRVTSVNSYKYESLPTVMFGPYQGNTAPALFRHAENRPA